MELLMYDGMAHLGDWRWQLAHQPRPCNRLLMMDMMGHVAIGSLWILARR